MIQEDMKKMFCKYCGKEIPDGSTFCPECGANLTENTPPQTPRPPVANPEDSSSFGFAFLCFLFPIVGLILYLVWKNTLPLRAKSCGKGAIVGVVVYVIFYILYAILLAVAIVEYAALPVCPVL